MKKGQGNYEVFTKTNFYEKRGVIPGQIIDLKGLMGDTSDNYPGVKGIGEKTALKLIQEYESIENILASKDFLPKGVRNKIDGNLDMLYLSRKLAEIKCDIPIDCPLDTALWQYDKAKVLEQFRKLNLDHMAKIIG